jgi:hypothetical protein
MSYQACDDPHPKRLWKKTYLSVVENAPGAKLFRHFYLNCSGHLHDGAHDGQSSCAFFVSSVLCMFNFLSESHYTVKETVVLMEKNGWYKINKPRRGAVLVWEEMEIEDYEHFHIGFYLGKHRAVSNNSQKQSPFNHHYTFNNQRAIESIYWHEKLEESVIV